MRTPDRRFSILGLAGLLLGAQIGCSASETTNTVGASGGSVGTGGKASTTGGNTNAGGKTSGGGASTGGQTVIYSTSCYQGGPCSGYASCTASAVLTCKCNGGVYSCTAN
jgi:hypothetical protein